MFFAEVEVDDNTGSAQLFSSMMAQKSLRNPKSPKNIQDKHVHDHPENTGDLAHGCQIGQKKASDVCK